MQHNEDTLADTNYTLPMTVNQFKFAQRRYPLLVVRHCSEPSCRCHDPAHLRQGAQAAQPPPATL